MWVQAEQFADKLFLSSFKRTVLKEGKGKGVQSLEVLPPRSLLQGPGIRV